jgi:2-keto-4-pentenoate hydratase/2-oxohepta-3-ene-1,7-dioic acid hydratase in catechol pathway
MKLLRYGPKGLEKPAILDDENTLRDISALVSDITPKSLAQGIIGRLEKVDVETLPIVPGKPRIGHPVADVRKVICVGLNYRDHALEAGMAITSEPILFMKAATALCGPYDDVMLPKGCEKGDWEVELGVVIKSHATRILEKHAMEHVAGYCVVNDLSERAYQLEQEGQWVKGKSLDTFGPMGPYLVTPDECADIHDRPIWLELNGKRLQDSNTCQMVFTVPQIVTYISQFMTLEPGDLILTGTPPGVGLGLNPPKYLKPDDIMKLGIDGLGEQQQTVRACI